MTREVPNPIDEPTVKIERVAAVLGVSRGSVYNGIKRGQIPIIKVGRMFLIPSAWLVRAVNGEQVAS